jgi:hypothetical protein
VVGSIGLPGFSQGKEPADQPAKVPEIDAVAEVDKATKDFTDQGLTQGSDKVEKMMKALDLKDTDISPATIISPQLPSHNGSCNTISDSRQTKLLSNSCKIDVDAETQFYEYDIRGLPLIAN